MVIEHLLHEEQKIKEAEFSHSREGEKATYVKRRHQKGAKCFRCGQSSHIKGDRPNISKEPDRKKMEARCPTGPTLHAKNVTPTVTQTVIVWTIQHALSVFRVQKHPWIVGSRATSHMCKDKRLFTDMIHLK